MNAAPFPAGLAARLAAFTLDLRLGDIPAPVLQLARLHLADAIGVGLGASSVPATRALMTQLQAEHPGKAVSTVFGLPGAAPASVAALLNGTAIHSLEYDDTHMESIVHGSSVIVPAALAAGEAYGLTLDDVVRLVAAGWETLVRLGQASPGGFQRQGFQVTSVGGAPIAAMLAAAARQLPLEQTVHAMGIAGSQASGIFEFLSNGSNVKALHPGWAAHAGLWAAACAQAGMTGPASVLEGRHGLYASYARDTEAGARLNDLIASLGTQWRLSDAAFKFYPCCHYIHPYLECAQSLLETAGARAIQSVHCRVAPGAATVICEPWQAKQRPADTSAAKHSLPYCLARALLGRPVDIAAMTAPELDPDAVQLAARITWEPRPSSPFPQRFDAVIDAVLEDGTSISLEVEQVRGSAERPPSVEDVRAKFMGNAQLALPDAADTLWRTIVGGGTMAALQQALRG